MDNKKPFLKPKVNVTKEDPLAPKQRSLDQLVASFSEQGSEPEVPSDPSKIEESSASNYFEAKEARDVAELKRQNVALERRNSALSSSIREKTEETTRLRAQLTTTSASSEDKDRSFASLESFGPQSVPKTPFLTASSLNTPVATLGPVTSQASDDTRAASVNHKEPEGLRDQPTVSNEGVPQTSREDRDVPPPPPVDQPGPAAQQSSATSGRYAEEYEVQYRWWYERLYDELYADIRAQIEGQCYAEAASNLRAEFQLKLEGLQHDVEQKARDNQPSSAADRRKAKISLMTNEAERSFAQGILHQDLAEMELQQQRNLDDVSEEAPPQPRRESTLLLPVMAAIGSTRANQDSSNKVYAGKKMYYHTLRSLNFWTVKDLLSQAMMFDAQPGSHKTKPYGYYDAATKTKIVDQYNDVKSSRQLCIQLGIAPSNVKMTDSIASFLEYPESEELLITALAPSDIYHYEGLIIDAFIAMENELGFTAESLSEARPEDFSRWLEMQVKKLELILSIVGQYPQWGPDRARGKKVQNPMSISVKGNTKANELGLYGLLFSGVGFDTAQQDTTVPNGTRRRVQNATLRQAIEAHLHKTKGTQSKSQEEDVAFQAGRFLAVFRNWNSNRKVLAHLEDKLGAALRSFHAPQRRSKAEADQKTTWPINPRRDSSSRSATPTHEDARRSERVRNRDDERRPEDEIRRLRALVQTDAKRRGLDSVFSEEEDFESDGVDGEEMTQYPMVPYGQRLEQQLDEDHYSTDTYSSEYPDDSGERTRAGRQGLLANVGPAPGQHKFQQGQSSSRELRGDARQQGSRVLESRRDAPRHDGQQRDHAGRDIPRYDSRHVQNPDAQLVNPRSRNPATRPDKSAYLKTLACDRFMMNQCPFDSHSCTYSHDTAICKAKFEAMKKAMEPTPAPSNALKHATAGQPAGQSAVSAMWAEVDERLRRVELAALTPRQQQQRQQPTQLSAAQRVAEGMRSAAYSDDEYEGSLGDTSEHSSGTEA